VECGLEKAFPKDAKRGFENWVALIGIMAQTYHGREDLSKGGSKIGLQEKVINMLSSYGYCTNLDYPIDLRDSGKDVRDWIDGERSLSGWSIFNGNGPDKDKFADIFGFHKATFSSMTYASEVFHNRWFDSTGVQERQWRFRSMIRGYQHNFPSTSFSSCAQALEKNIQRTKPLNLCSTPKAHNSYAPPVSLTALANNDKLYKTLMANCHLSGPHIHKNQNCDNICWHSATLGEGSTHMPRCYEPPANDNHGGPDSPGEGPGGPGGHGKGGEGGGNSDRGGGPGGPGGPGGGGGKGGEGGGGSAR
jgi:hypothetical protein